MNPFRDLNFRRQLLTWGVIVSVLINLLCVVQTIKDNEINQVQLEEAETTSIFLNDFKESDRQHAYSVMKLGEVENIISTNDTMYMVTSKGEQLAVPIDVELENYAKLQGLEVTHVTNLYIPEKVAEATIWANGWFTLSLVTAIILGLFLYRDIKMTQFNLVEASGDGERTTITKGGADGTVEIPKIKFSDVQGVDDLKKDVMRLVDFLKNRDKYIAMGARPPKGIILYGPPGTGKTMLAKAIAGEAKVPFFSMAGSDFVEMYVGVGAKRVRELYNKARKAAPAIVFIDEVDAIAHKRGRDNNSEDDKTINALLAELDGFSGESGVITICATNRLDMLDSAFQRAGRFDLKLAVSLPDRKARQEILKIHSKNKKLSRHVSLSVWANKTPGFSGAELESLLNEAALLAVSREHTKIEPDDMDDALYKILMKGNKREEAEMSEVKRITAWHEAGHALASKLLTNDSVPTVTIVGSTSGAGGVTFRAPEEVALHTKKYLENLIKTMLAGRAAEEIYTKDFDNITTGASNDIKQATNIAREYVECYGMGNIGLVDMTQFNGGTGNQSVIEEVSQLNTKLYNDVKGVLLKNVDKLEKIANALLKKETINEDELDAIIGLNQEKTPQLNLFKDFPEYADYNENQ